MRLHSVIEQDQCFNSLSDTMKSRIVASLTEQSVKDCAKLGYAVGTQTFSYCVLSKRANYSSAPDGGATTSFAGGGREMPARDLSGTSQHEREEYACVAMGIDPGQTAFEFCVQDLDMALYLAHHPPAVGWNPYG
jgi:hypothetical protein